MINKTQLFTESILSLPRFAKKIIIIIFDSSLCVLCTWIAFYLRLDQFILIKDVTSLAALLSVCIALPVFWLVGLYRTIFRYSDLSIVFSVSIASLVYGFLYFLVFGVYGVSSIPRSIGILQPMVLFFAIVCYRLIVKYLLQSNNPLKNKYQYKKKNISVRSW